MTDVSFPSLSLLNDWMHVAREANPDLLLQATDGHCDAFALALVACLNTHFPQVSPQLVVISRKRVALDDPDTIEENNPLSHVLVQIKDILMDVNGTEADEHWEGNWVQPYEREAHGFGENEAFEDLFDYHSISTAALVDLRQSHSHRPVHAEHQSRFQALLLIALMQVQPVLNMMGSGEMVKLTSRRRRP